MRRYLIEAIAGAGLLFGGLPAGAQYQPRTEYRNQVRIEREAGSHQRFFDRVQGDLSVARESTLPYSGDRRRLIRAEQEVSDVQRAFAAGDFSRRECDQAIAALERVVDRNRLSNGDRNILLVDASRLRALADRLAG